MPLEKHKAFTVDIEILILENFPGPRLINILSTSSILIFFSLIKLNNKITNLSKLYYNINYKIKVNFKYKKKCYKINFIITKNYFIL